MNVTPKSNQSIRLEAEQLEQKPIKQRSLPRKLESLKHTQSVPNLVQMRSANAREAPLMYDFKK
jgi:hypothetical protein